MSEESNDATGRWSHHPHLQTPTVRTGHEPEDSPYLADHDRWEWRRRIRSNPRHYRWYRIAVGIAGGVLIILAPVSAPLPGPGGTALFLLGLAVWSSEFRWARRFTQWFHPLHRRYLSWPRWRRVLFWVGIVALFWLLGYVGLLITGIPEQTPSWAARWLAVLPGVH